MASGIEWLWSATYFSAHQHRKLQAWIPLLLTLSTQILLNLKTAPDLNWHPSELESSLCLCLQKLVNLGLYIFVSQRTQKISKRLLKSCSYKSNYLWANKKSFQTTLYGLYVGKILHNEDIAYICICPVAIYNIF